MGKRAEKKVWMIGICCSDADGVRLSKVYGTESQVKRHLLKLVKEDRSNDEEDWDSGTETISEIEVDKTLGTLEAYANYFDYHIDYTAKPEDAVVVTTL